MTYEIQNVYGINKIMKMGFQLLAPDIKIPFTEITVGIPLGIGGFLEEDGLSVLFTRGININGNGVEAETKIAIDVNDIVKLEDIRKMNYGGSSIGLGGSMRFSDRSTLDAYVFRDDIVNGTGIYQEYGGSIKTSYFYLIGTVGIVAYATATGQLDWLQAKELISQKFLE